MPINSVKVVKFHFHILVVKYKLYSSTDTTSKKGELSSYTTNAKFTEFLLELGQIQLEADVWTAKLFGEVKSVVLTTEVNHTAETRQKTILYLECG